MHGLENSIALNWHSQIKPALRGQYKGQHNKGGRCNQPPLQIVYFNEPHIGLLTQ
jgi:hypothetical protein